jgi:hypothetical protein
LSDDRNSWDEERFTFDKDDGLDTITDFNPACIVCFPIPGMPPPGDKIVLLDGTSADRASVAQGVTVSPDGDAVLHYDDTTFTLAGVEADRVTED